MPTSIDTTRAKAHLSQVEQPALGLGEQTLTPNLMPSRFQRLGHHQGGLRAHGEFLLAEHKTLITRAAPLLWVLTAVAEQTQAVVAMIAETVGLLAEVGTPLHISSQDLLLTPVRDLSKDVEQATQADTLDVHDKRKILIVRM